MQASIGTRKFSYPEVPTQGKFGTRRDNRRGTGRIAEEIYVRKKGTTKNHRRIHQRCSQSGAEETAGDVRVHPQIRPRRAGRNEVGYARIFLSKDSGHVRRT